MALPDIIRELLENGVHFGHLSKHWNPKMKKFIFGKKKNVYIIDLEKTAQKIQEAKEFVKQKAKEEGRILFVATKRQLRSTIRELATSCGMPYVSERWIGGLLTNFSTIRSRVNRYLELLEQREKGGFDAIVKKEVVKLNREIERMEKRYSGVTLLDEFPSCVFVVDPKKEIACIREANKLSIPVVALIDTDADPETINYPIPGNDDSIKSVKYVTSCVVEAVKEGLEQAESIVKEASKDSPAQESAEEKAKEESEVPKKKRRKKPPVDKGEEGK